ncbi:unnamed protein product [Porites lobata]|uniref:Uncharacterized protein n=1 Tax=Porites lobata TaxID=104759 RepID=A0ABN8P9Y9_9CNID|nr:unnamed protein product [Porites lobata]
MVSEYSWLVSKTLGELLSCERFDKSAIIQRDLSLSQAFCLLWQNDKTGDVAGRQRPSAMSHTACAAVLLDLYILEKVDFEKEIKQWMDRRRQVISVQVKDATMTSSYLDKALFSDIVKYHNNSMGRKKTTVEWIIQGSHERENSATAVLDSLVWRGILGRESMLFGRKYPTLNSDPEKKLIDEIREVVLKNQPADFFTWTLLKLVYEADCCSSKKARVLSRYFSADEFQGAQEAIKALVTVPVEDSLIASPDAESLESFELKVVE